MVEENIVKHKNEKVNAEGLTDEILKTQKLFPWYIFKVIK